MHNRANFQFCQFFVVLHKIGHECIMTLHGHFTKITKKTKHGNVYNDRSTLKNGNQKTRFFGSTLPNYRTTKLHKRAHKATKKTKHGNLYNDLANVQKTVFLRIIFLR